MIVPTGGIIDLGIGFPYDFPELTMVMMHGGEPRTALAVKLMLKWPGLHDMPDVPFRDDVWPKFLRENAICVFKLDQQRTGVTA